MPIARIDADRTKRFESNRIVVALLDAAQAGVRLDLNGIWDRFSDSRYREELQELYRLIGYSHTGYAEIFGDEELAAALKLKGTP